MFRALSTRLAVLGGAGILAGMLMLGPAAADIQIPPKGSPLRATILDTVRPMVEAEVGPPVEFVVTTIRVLGEWAFVIAQPQRKGGGQIPYTYTRYQTAVDEGAFDNQVIALLRQTPSGWLVYGYSLGATDVPWEEWRTAFPVPPELFQGP